MSGRIADALLVAGTTSDAGKSTIVAGLCRALRRRGIDVAPFKAQNMSNNSAVALDGGEIGRAQALQAYACGLDPITAFNPILLKPGSDHRSQVIVRGHPAGTIGGADYRSRRRELAAVAVDALAGLRHAHEVVLCEGAGSPAEINLREGDIANIGLARAADMPVLVVGDIDRGGVLAHFHGTVAVLEPEDQRLIGGFVVNKFRGDRALLQPGLDMVTERTGRPVLGVVGYDPTVAMDVEDSLNVPVESTVGTPVAPLGAGPLRVAAIRLPRISNSTDVEALACEPGVEVRWTADPAIVRDAHLVVLPGTKSTVDDLAWLRAAGLAAALERRVAARRPLLAICGGYQMLARRIVDDVESGRGVVEGLGLLDLDIAFHPSKTVRRVAGVADGTRVTGYEIHHGAVIRTAEAPLLTDDRYGPEGSRRGAVVGTHWHGLLESDGFRRALLRDVVALTGPSGFIVADNVSAVEVRDRRLDRLADLVEAGLDVDAVLGIARGGPPHVPTLFTRLQW